MTKAVTHPAPLWCAVQQWAAAKQAELLARRAMNAYWCELKARAEPEVGDGGVAPCHQRFAHVEDYECEPCRIREPLFQDFKAKHIEAKTLFRRMQRVALRSNSALEQP